MKELHAVAVLRAPWSTMYLEPLCHCTIVPTLLDWPQWVHKEESRSVIESHKRGALQLLTPKQLREAKQEAKRKWDNGMTEVSRPCIPQAYKHMHSSQAACSLLAWS